MRALLKITILTTALIAAGAVAAPGQQLKSSDVIRGMGDRIPVGKKNVSLSPLFKVYTFDQAGLKFVQINSLKDDVITVITVTPGAQSRLPIGSAAEEQLIAVNDDKDRPLGMVTAAASCPCSATVVYQDSKKIIVVVYGSNGEYITSYVLPRSDSSIPPE
ncbi:hypothetical protein [Xanthomonas translucens]|uniref:hypothetical protein n=1 Tax=Xanthomonas campestris pv. translucens TaxID=343 RepID=UPI00071E96DA|nr:hypothetical protein [Xanthomonas translucens]KTF39569.1 hypothetical protein OZ12_11440 [Xanthomonas translucens pv. translucens]